MWVDPIVEEIREIRRQLAAEHGNDLHRICEAAREWERQNPGRLVDFAAEREARDSKLKTEEPTTSKTDRTS